MANRFKLEIENALLPSVQALFDKHGVVLLEALANPTDTRSTFTFEASNDDPLLVELYGLLDLLSLTKAFQLGQELSFDSEGKFPAVPLGTIEKHLPEMKKTRFYKAVAGLLAGYGELTGSLSESNLTVLPASLVEVLVKSSDYRMFVHLTDHLYLEKNGKLPAENQFGVFGETAFTVLQESLLKAFGIHKENKQSVFEERRLLALDRVRDLNLDEVLAFHDNLAQTFYYKMRSLGEAWQQWRGDKNPDRQLLPRDFLTVLLQEQTLKSVIDRVAELAEANGFKASDAYSGVSYLDHNIGVTRFRQMQEIVIDTLLAQE